ncbi:MAG: hypothetical protein JWM89_2501 [Acidimicrobiales bacterium]|nr:hypothetical protein [Acidimicrobiales bacterium]
MRDGRRSSANPAVPPGRFHVNGMASGSEPSPPLAGNLPVSRGTVAWPRRLGSNDEAAVARAERSRCPGLHALLRRRVLMFWPSPRGAARRSVQPAGSNQQGSRWPASRGGAVEGPQAAARTPKSKHQWPAAPSGSAWIGPRRPPGGDHSHRRGAARVHGVTDRAAREVVSARSAPLPAGPGDCTKAPPHGATHEQRVPGEPSLHRPALGDGKDASQARSARPGGATRWARRSPRQRPVDVTTNGGDRRPPTGRTRPGAARPRCPGLVLRVRGAVLRVRGAAPTRAAPAWRSLETSLAVDLGPAGRPLRARCRRPRRGPIPDQSASTARPPDPRDSAILAAGGPIDDHTRGRTRVCALQGGGRVVAHTPPVETAGCVRYGWPARRSAHTSRADRRVCALRAGAAGWWARRSAHTSGGDRRVCALRVVGASWRAHLRW